MAISQRAVLVCDDVRQELHNKITAVGVYSGSIVLPAGTGPIALPKLAIVSFVAGLKGFSRLRYRQSVSLSTGEDSQNQSEPEPPELIDEPHNPENDEHSFFLQIAPAIFPGPCSMRIVLDVNAGDEAQRFEYSVRVLRKPKPNVH